MKDTRCILHLGWSWGLLWSCPRYWCWFGICSKRTGWGARNGEIHLGEEPTLLDGGQRRMANRMLEGKEKEQPWCSPSLAMAVCWPRQEETLQCNGRGPVTSQLRNCSEEVTYPQSPEHCVSLVPSWHIVLLQKSTNSYPLLCQIN